MQKIKVEKILEKNGAKIWKFKERNAVIIRDSKEIKMAGKLKYSEKKMRNQVFQEEKKCQKIQKLWKRNIEK